MSKCPGCGFDIPEGELICPNCKREIQLVPTYETLSTSLMNKENEDKKAEEEAKIREEKLIEEEERYYRKNRKNKIILITVIAAAIAICAVFLISYIVKMTGTAAEATYEDYYNQAITAYNDGEYDNAAGLLEEALALDPSNTDCLILQAKISYARGNSYEAIAALRELILNNPELVEAYRELIEIYIDQEDSDSINSILDSCPDSIKTALSDYITGAPIFSLEGGTYQTEQDITITSTGESIYYTVDGSVPTNKSTLYTAPVHLGEGTTYLKAISYSSSGIASNVTEAEYIIDKNAPVAPVITPSSGTYYGSDNTITVSVADGCTCYYAFDSKPSVSGTLYTGPVTMPEGAHIFYAIAVNSRGVSSPISASTFIYYTEDPNSDNSGGNDDYYNNNDDSSNQDTITPTETETPDVTETPEPTDEPTAEPTEEPTTEPTKEPTAEPTEEPTTEPTDTPDPTEEPEPVDSSTKKS